MIALDLEMSLSPSGENDLVVRNLEVFEDNSDSLSKAPDVPVAQGDRLRHGYSI
jgi:hypothetical protein